MTENAKRMVQLVEALWDCGIVVVAAAGNYGPDSGSIALPGSSRKIITVGASNDVSVRHAYRVKEHYSGRGPTRECVMKPDVVAPGSGIYSCNANYDGYETPPYIMKSGTSMATPVAAGAIALLLSKFPDMKNMEVKLRLRESCTWRNLSEYQQGWGEINVQRLLKK
jgi:serine protease AprX